MIEKMNRPISKKQGFKWKVILSVFWLWKLLKFFCKFKECGYKTIPKKTWKSLVAYQHIFLISQTHEQMKGYQQESQLYSNSIFSDSENTDPLSMKQASIELLTPSSISWENYILYFNILDEKDLCVKSYRKKSS